jgi:hypothetical protein
MSAAVIREIDHQIEQYSGRDYCSSTQLIDILLDIRLFVVDEDAIERMESDGTDTEEDRTPALSGS